MSMYMYPITNHSKNVILSKPMEAVFKWRSRGETNCLFMFKVTKPIL